MADRLDERSAGVVFFPDLHGGCGGFSGGARLGGVMAGGSSFGWRFWTVVQLEMETRERGAECVVRTELSALLPWLPWKVAREMRRRDPERERGKRQGTEEHK